MDDADDEEMRRLLNAQCVVGYHPIGFIAADVDLWKLESTAFSHPELWWGHDIECSFEGCGCEPALSCSGVYVCRRHLEESA